jgi:hypothetical protein
MWARNLETPLRGRQSDAIPAALRHPEDQAQRVDP